MGKYADPTEEFSFFRFEKSNMKSAFDLSTFKRSFGMRMILSALCLALLNEAILSLYEYYETERFLKAIPFSLDGIQGVFFFMLINHVFYRIDFKKLTNIAERICLDLIYLVLIIIIRISYGSIKSGSFNFNFEFQQIGAVLFVFFLFFCFESFLAIILYPLRRIGWPFSIKSK